MLKRNDLVKQFELVVRQEIKNHQDTISSVFSILNKITMEISELRKKVEEVQAESNSNKVRNEILVDNVQRSQTKVIEDFARLSNDQRAINERNSIQIDQGNENISGCLMNARAINQKYQDIISEVSDLGQMCKQNTKRIEDTCDELLKRFRNEVLKMKREVLDSPTEASMVKKQLEEKFSCHKVDVAGIMRELNVYKKENMITQKKIENIYTLIDRLNKSGVK